ncbi:hypothetical protein EI94DRAFT_1703382 [Lactarius quietus]|nr:hypothetical protein EI94DRAFT_1703382 [Lactarius quietus]
MSINNFMLVPKLPVEDTVPPQIREWYRNTGGNGTTPSAQSTSTLEIATTIIASRQGYHAYECWRSKLGQTDHFWYSRHTGACSTRPEINIISPNLRIAESELSWSTFIFRAGVWTVWVWNSAEVRKYNLRVKAPTPSPVYRLACRPVGYAKLAREHRERLTLNLTTLPDTGRIFMAISGSSSSCGGVHGRGLRR